MAIWEDVGSSVLGKIAKKTVSNVIGWGASTIFGLDKKTVSDNVYDTLQTIGAATRDAGLFDERSGIMSKSMPSLDFTGGISSVSYTHLTLPTKRIV